MNSFSSRLGCILAAGMVLVLGAVARADESNLGRLRESDYPTFCKLRLARAVAEEKGMFAHGNKAKQAAIEAQAAKALAEVGWSEERFGAVSAAVDSVLNNLADPEQELDPEIDKTTIATVKAHRQELQDTNALQQRARQIMVDEQTLERRGRAPTAAELNGKWVMNFDRTVASIADGMPAEIVKNAGDELRKHLTGATYTFGAGNTITAVNERPGVPPETSQGFYRLEGNTLVIIMKMGSRNREDKIDIGIKEGRLMIGMMGAYSVFERQ
jgi:hypothetical protein